MPRIQEIPRHPLSAVPAHHVHLREPQRVVEVECDQRRDLVLAEVVRIHVSRGCQKCSKQGDSVRAGRDLGVHGLDHVALGPDLGGQQRVAQLPIVSAEMHASHRAPRQCAAPSG